MIFAVLLLRLFYGNISKEGGLFMPDNKELVKMLRAVFQEEIQPIHQELQELRTGQQGLSQELQQVNARLDKLEKGQVALEKGQRKLQQDVSTIKKEVHAVWDDILRLDNRLIVQERKTAQ